MNRNDIALHQKNVNYWKCLQTNQIKSILHYLKVVIDSKRHLIKYSLLVFDKKINYILSFSPTRKEIMILAVFSYIGLGKNGPSTKSEILVR